MNLRTDQICEVLEIVTYTMVKLDPAQEKKMIDASYLFIHQDTEGMKTAQENKGNEQNIVSKFDTLTKVAGKKAGGLEYSTWNQVLKAIETETKTQFLYINKFENPAKKAITKEYARDCVNFKKQVILGELNEIFKKPKM